MSTPGQPPELCVGAVVVRDGMILLIERGRGPAVGQWSVPGGRVEAGETMAEAVVREVHEETGLAVSCGRFVGWVERIGGSHHFVIMDFEAELRSDGQPGPVAGDDAADAAWIPLDGLGDVDLVDGLRAFLDEHGITSNG